MNNSQVIACFAIYSGEYIAYQGNFQVLEDRNLYSPSTRGDGEFEFLHFYEGTQCYIKLSYSKDDAIQAHLDLEIPINRSKVKWKHSKLGEIYNVQYHCVLEFAEHSKEHRKIQRRAAIARLSRQPDVNFYSVGEANSDEDA